MHGLHSLQFPPGQSPVVSKIYIYYGNVPLEFTVPPLPVNCFNRSVFLDKLSNLVENQKTIALTCRLMVEGKHYCWKWIRSSALRRILWFSACNENL